MSEELVDDSFEITLKQCGVEGRIMDRASGPSMEHLFVKLAPGAAVKKVTAKLQDISFHLNLPSLTITPDISKGLLRFSYLKETRDYPRLVDMPTKGEGMDLPFVSGIDMLGATVVKDLSKCPNVLIGGATGGGKSVLLHSILCSLIRSLPPEQLRLVIVDPKQGAEFGCYADLRHHFARGGLVTDPMHLCDIMHNLVRLSNQRYSDFAVRRVVNLREYNLSVGPTRALPHIVVVVDELADLMGEYRAAISPLLQCLAQKSRAAGIHLILATQRPSVKVVTGDIKANCPTRIALRVQTGIDSRVVLDRNGAENLLGNGDMLYSSGTNVERLQAPFMSQEDIEQVVSQVLDNQYQPNK